MKTRFTAIMLAGFMLVVAGCGSVGSDFTTNVREKFEGPTYRAKTVAADGRAAYEAALRATEKAGFHFVSGGPAQGRIEALSVLTANDSLKGAHQLAMKVKLSPVAAGGTEVAVLITEQVEDDFNKGSGQATETTLRDTPLYDVFFREIEQALADK